MIRHRPASVYVALTLFGVLLVMTGCSTSSPGATIFRKGEGHAGPIPRSVKGGPYSTDGLNCAFCHGAQGQGGRIGPPITRSVLGASHTITHGPSAETPNPAPVTEGPWTTEQTVEAVRSGRTPEGNYLGGRMPRWQLDEQDGSALAEYLGTL